MRHAEASYGAVARRMNNKNNKPDKKPLNGERLRALWPQIAELVRPRWGLLLLGLLLMVISKLAGLVLPWSTKYFIDDVLGRKHTDMLLPLVGAVVGATMVQGLTAFALTQLLSKGAQRLIAEMRMKVQEHIGRLPVDYYDENKSGALVSRIMSDVEGVRNLVGTGLVEFLGGLTTSLLALVLLFRISPTLTWLALAFIAVFGAGSQVVFSRIRPIFRERGKITSEVTGRLTESLGGVRVIKGYHAEKREAEVFAAGATRILQNVLKSLTAVSAMSLVATILMGLIGAIVMYVSALQIQDGKLTLGDFVTFSALLAFLVAPVFQMVNIGTQITEALAGLERTREVFRETAEHPDPERTAILPSIVGEVKFEDAAFAYKEGTDVIKGVSFVARPGTVTALVGSSGSGKSTLIGLVSAFYKPRAGRILVDGMDLSTVQLSSFRSQLGMVLQDSFLFDGSIRDNILFARPEASEADFLEACRIARVDEFAERFDEGFNTIVGERGVKLSGGQRQRVSIARAILAKPRILILDEATSSLDSESEEFIQEGLGWLMQGRTTFVIAHRLSTIRRADQILVLEGGLVVESGTHGELLKKHGRYYELYTKQHGEPALLQPPEAAVQ
jgi:ABC-type multidrug transport system fused ATPase/permease subunit